VTVMLTAPTMPAVEFAMVSFELKFSAAFNSQTTNYKFELNFYIV
jgi:hypothetical protein